MRITDKNDELFLPAKFFDFAADEGDDLPGSVAAVQGAALFDKIFKHINNQ
jgi:hypothetical protein